MIKARSVQCAVTAKLKIQSCQDPGYKARPDKPIDVDFDTTGEHYGWPLGKLIEKGYDERTDTVADELEVCANPAADKAHFNSIAPQGYEFVKLDVGYWGSYYRDRTESTKKQSREFGMIIGQDVYLCRFHSPGHAGSTPPFKDDIDKLAPDPEGFPSPARKFMQLLIDRGFSCQLISHAAVRSSSLTKGMSDKVLKIFLPDLHLPERWPDEPATDGPEPALCKDPEARRFLQGHIMCSQHSTGPLSGNSIDKAGQTRLQEFLEKVLVDAAVQSEYFLEDKAAGMTRRYDAREVLAELAFVERRVRCASTWFYQPVAGFKAIASPRFEGLGLAKSNIRDNAVKSAMSLAAGGPLSAAGVGAAAMGVATAAGLDVAKGAEEHQYAKQTTFEPSTSDPGAGIDLINFLRMIRELQKDASVEVYQVGDLLELWMNREFLYMDFPSIDKNLGHGKVLPDLASVAGLVLMSSSSMVGDGFQQRRGPGWRDDSKPSSDGLRRYVYDEYPSTTELLARRKTGWNFKREGTLKTPKMYSAIGEMWVSRRNSSLGDQLKRAAKYGATATTEEIGRALVDRQIRELKQRVLNVENSSLPLSPEAKGSQGWHELTQNDPALIASMRRDPNAAAVPNDEFYWSVPCRVRREEFYFNSAILSLFQEVGCKYIHGNHDGYRSDPLLNGGTAPYQAQEYLHIPGVWVEHSHRYDDFNRDGRIFGAGMTNIVHFFNAEMLALDDAKEKVPASIYKSAERKATIPGATQWFVHVNLSDPAKRGTDFLPLKKTQNFCVYVGGHTHAADLVRVRLVSKKS